MEKKISVVIPNYNGKELLAKNLKNVIKNCPNCEIIVVDDGSGDDSVKFIRHNFKNIKLVEHKFNKGFAHAVNSGVKQAKGELVVFLNTDVSPRVNFLDKSTKHFSQNSVFAVGFADYSHENGEVIIRGKGSAKFKKGFLTHEASDSKSGETLWVSGGSAIIEKKKFLELQGFNTIFAPFYWEDIDLSYRAWKSGYKCLFEPESKVDHYHQEGAIKKNYSNFYIKTISYRNQFVFVWNNIEDDFLLFEHLAWFPYHAIKAFLSLDFAFFAGFFLALSKIPKLITDYPSSTKSRLTDKEVLEKFAKL